MQQSTEICKKRLPSHFISVDSLDVTEGTLKLPSIGSTTPLRSITPQANKATHSQLVMPSIEETKFLSTPMKSANRIFTRAVSAKKAPSSSLQLH